MGRFLLVVAILVGCSSSPDATQAAVDAGWDVRTACGVPGEAVECLCAEGRPGLGRCLSNGTIDPCVCLPGPASDAAVDVADSTPIETGGSDAADGSSVDARETAEQALCAAGAPRLTWKGSAGCYDNGLAEVIDAFYCRFRVASDGRVRCMPSGSTEIGGYVVPTCTARACDGGLCTTGELTTWTTDPIPPYVMIGTRVARVYADARAGTWYRLESGVCVEQRMGPTVTLYPFFNSKNESAYVRAYVSDSSFYAASL